MRERGWGSPNSDEGTYTVVLFIYKYFVNQRLLSTPLIYVFLLSQFSALGPTIILPHIYSLPNPQGAVPHPLPLRDGRQVEII